MYFDNMMFDPSLEASDRPIDHEVAYVYDDPQVALAVNIALATSRPLLITGPPGSGKSSLAADVARRLGWAYLDTVVTSRTRLSDLVGEVDMVRRLSDAQTRSLKTDYDHYLVPGVLWWAFDPDSARSAPLSTVERLTRPDRQGCGIVVLIDEIDKGEPDLPNDLLRPLGGAGIDIPFTGLRQPQFPLVIFITSNGEREMPPAFLRRCLSLELGHPSEAFLVRVARQHYGFRNDDLYAEIARRMLVVYNDSVSDGLRPPSTAEFLDTVAACIQFGVSTTSRLWEAVEETALGKKRRSRADNA